jgi:transcriptional regulator with XRE-family HTH domain
MFYATLMHIFINLQVDISMSLDHIGEQIKTLRKARNWSQQQLADMAGLDRTTVGMLERNTYNDIGIRKVQRVLELLDRKLIIGSNGLPTLDDLLSQTGGVIHG